MCCTCILTILHSYQSYGGVLHTPGTVACEQTDIVVSEGLQLCDNEHGHACIDHTLTLPIQQDAVVGDDSIGSGRRVPGDGDITRTDSKQHYLVEVFRNWRMRRLRRRRKSRSKGGGGELLCF